MTDLSKVELNITSSAKSLPIVRSAVERMAEMEGFGDADAHALTLAIDEALANVIKHGYDGRPDQPITITLSTVKAADTRPGVAVEVRDKGRQVDPKTIQGRNLDDVRPGGLGVHIIQAVMDEYNYSCPPDGGMLLRMVKYVAGGADCESQTALADPADSNEHNREDLSP
ncbi:MAG: ATP-binding protein [Phycisphaerae bacterium]|nr:ATP-binding protein [Phycisphaerae bacterium]